MPLTNEKPPINRRAGVRPEWLKIRVPGGLDQLPVSRLMNDLALNTVCQEARCPNIFECWSAGTATFMILGEICTRRCTFCAVGKGKPLAPDDDEPRRVAEAVEKMRVKHAVITMVNRDDMSDGGAEHIARCVAAVRDRNDHEPRIASPMEAKTAEYEMPHDAPGHDHPDADPKPHLHVDATAAQWARRQ